MGVTLYKDMLRFINAELMGEEYSCLEHTVCIEDRIALLKRKESLELMILKQLGWA